jgi:hypothetical protein
MIYLIDRVLPESYFANNLRALSVDMAVFRDLLQSQLPQLASHLKHLQAAAKDQSTGGYFTSQLSYVSKDQQLITPCRLYIYDCYHVVVSLVQHFYIH